MSADYIVCGSFYAGNSNDPENDPKYIDITIPVLRKPKKFFLYRALETGGKINFRGSVYDTSSTYGKSCINNSLTHSSACFYDSERSTTQYYVQTNDPNVAVTDTCKMYDIGSTYDHTITRSITNSAITVRIKVKYTTESFSSALYGGNYHYIIFY